jgi:hypothetical protein
VSRRTVTAGVIVAAVGLFAWEWTAAPRVHTDPSLQRALAQVRGVQYLGTRFEGLPLRSVRPFVYSDCPPGGGRALSCKWLRVRAGHVTGSDPQQVRRARAALRPVG